MTEHRFEARTHDRRTILRLSCLGLAGPVLPALAFGKADFWNQKEVTEWSDAECQRILTNSPWTKKATVSFGGGNMGGGMDGGPMGGGGGPMGGGGGGPMGGGGGGPMGGGGGGMGGGMGGGGMRGGGMGAGGRGGESPGSATTQFNIFVRWESAEPVLRALKRNPEIQTDRYLIAVTGLPVLGAGTGRGAGRGLQSPRVAAPDPGRNPELLQQNTRLEVKGQAPLHPRNVERVEEDPPRIVFHFDRAELPITPAAKEILFSMAMGPLTIKAKFTVREMMYGNHVAL